MQNLPEIDIDTEYDTYDGLSRVVSVMGFPLVPSILFFFVFLFITMFAMRFFGLKALAILLLTVPLLLFLKIMTAHDDQAIRIIGIEIYWRLQRRNAGIFGDTFTLLPTKFGNVRDDYYRFAREEHDKAAVAARLFAEVQSARCGEHRSL